MTRAFTAIRALLKRALPHTADDARQAPSRGAPKAPQFVDAEGRPLQRAQPAPAAAGGEAPAGAGAPPAPPVAPATSQPTTQQQQPQQPMQPQQQHPQQQHGALLDLAEGLERAVLQPAAAAAGAPALAAVHGELEAERVGDPFRRHITEA
jgi:hypothetical protein